MIQTAFDEKKLKEVFKSAILEIFEERREDIYKIFSEVVEDFALAKAIKEGEKTKSVSRSEIFKILEARD